MELEAAFVAQVVDAYEHMYDLVHLRTHPLTAVLPSPGDAPLKKRARQLHQTLLDVLTELDPGPQAPAFSNEWRRHRLMTLRYVKGLPPQSVADQLNISLRHYYRVHESALTVIAGILWHRYVVRPSEAAEKQEVGLDSAARWALLRLEAARAAQADRHAQLDQVLEGVIGVLREMIHKHSVQVELRVSPDLPPVSTGETLLRQLLLAALGYLLERGRGGILTAQAEVISSGIFLVLQREPAASLLQATDSSDTIVSALAEMAQLGAGHIQPLYSAMGITGFELQLPTAEQTLLVVDDNDDILELFQRFLLPHRYRVLTAHSAVEAWEKIAQVRPAVITLDLMMPQQDGWDFLQTLLNRPDTYQIPIIVCSVLKQRELALSLGAAGFLEKPVTEEALLAILESLSVT